MLSAAIGALVLSAVPAAAGCNSGNAADSIGYGLNEKIAGGRVGLRMGW